MAAALGLAAGIFFALILRADTDRADTVSSVENRPQTVTQEKQAIDPRPSSPADPGVPSARKVQKELESKVPGIPETHGFEGDMSVVVWSSEWQGETASFDGEDVRRMWSLSKPVLAVTALRQGLGDQQVEQEVDEAISTSSNCSARFLTLYIQGQQGGSPDGAIESFYDTLDLAGALPSVRPQIASPEQDCAKELQGKGLQGTAFPSPQFGTTEWSTKDGARFMEFLGTGDFGPEGERVLAAMQIPKGPSNDPGNTCGTEPGYDWNWGMGNGFAGSEPAFKSGWGLTSDGVWEVAQNGWVEGQKADYAASVALETSSDVPIDQCVPENQREAMDAVFEVIRGALEGEPDQSDPDRLSPGSVGSKGIPPVVP